MSDQKTFTPFAYSIATAATLLSLSRARLYDLIGEGKIEARKFDNRSVIYAAEIDRYMAAAPLAQIAKPRPRR